MLSGRRTGTAPTSCANTARYAATTTTGPSPIPATRSLSPATTTAASTLPVTVAVVPPATKQASISRQHQMSIIGTPPHPFVQRGNRDKEKLSPNFRYFSKLTRRICFKYIMSNLKCLLDRQLFPNSKAHFGIRHSPVPVSFPLPLPTPLAVPRRGPLPAWPAVPVP